MTTDLAKHYREVFATEINSLKMKDVVGFAFEGPIYVPSPPPPQGPGGLTVGWSLMLTLKHNVLVGQPDVGVHIPLIGMNPDDDIIRKGAQFLMEKAREERHAQSTAQLHEGPPLEGTVIPPANVPVQGDGSPVPPGLLPAGIGGSVQQRSVAPGPRVKAKATGKATDLEGNELSADGEVKKKDEPEVTDSESGTFKIIDKRKRRLH